MKNLGILFLILGIMLIIATPFTIEVIAGTAGFLTIFIGIASLMSAFAIKVDGKRKINFLGILLGLALVAIGITWQVNTVKFLANVGFLMGFSALVYGIGLLALAGQLNGAQKFAMVLIGLINIFFAFFLWTSATLQFILIYLAIILISTGINQITMSAVVKK